jgi:hypothetical protein
MALADGVDDLLGNSFGFYGARRSLFEAGVKLSQSFLWRFLNRAAASGRHRVSSLTLSLFRGCHIQMLAEVGQHGKIPEVQKEKANLISQTGLY